MDTMLANNAQTGEHGGAPLGNETASSNLTQSNAKSGVASFSQLTEKLATYLPPADLSRIREAFRFADEMHLGQIRMSGEPYISHPIAVAETCAEWKLDAQAIMAALLHDVMEDHGVRKEELIERFSAQVAELVDGVSKLDKIEFQTHVEAQGENFRKMLLAMASDIRVMLIKLADRLHNMRTLGVMRPDKRRRIAHETMEVYVPIAHRLGMNGLYRELQDLSFANMNPLRHRALAKALKGARGNRQEILHPVEEAVKAALVKAGIQADVYGREKTLYGIYRKMQTKNLSFSQILDVYGFRVVVNNEMECYQALGVLHGIYKPIPGKVQDYIAMPKMNKYQSLHTTVIGPLKTPLEFLIRTHEMHHIAESGVASHWMFKEDAEDESMDIQQHSIAWLQSLLDIQQQTGNAAEFLEHVKFDLFPDSVYVFTPKAKIISLPRHATALDFAYSIHSDLGDQTIAVKINNEPASLRTELQNGDIVEVITSPTSRPNPAWLTFVRTGKARSSIRSYLRTASYGESVELGKHLLAQAMTSLNLAPEISPAIAERLKSETGSKTLDDFYADIGTGKRLATMVAHRVMSLVRSKSKQKNKSESAKDEVVAKVEPILIYGSEGMNVQLAECCRPIPGDNIVAQLNFDRGLVIHRSDCEHVKRFVFKEPEKWIPVAWAEELNRRFESPLSVYAMDEKGLLARIAAVLSEGDANITNVGMEEGRGETFTKLKFIIQVENRDHLARLMRRIRHVHGVTKLARE
ncbi:MAG: bifunctional (p)ppGpp synthetase/guanosine-3',5'-bis(diphosphate) 3'-pyrophosphohydrolase [Oxalobacter sp.]|nr:MAG: bifunctional (p)ppGpp synthetase/guanosine-3',5'-bis(diphosphate) 3'-pyrophosphohydrolase [Oxalobacter sp.]